MSDVVACVRGANFKIPRVATVETNIKSSMSSMHAWQQHSTCSLDGITYSIRKCMTESANNKSSWDIAVADITLSTTAASKRTTYEKSSGHHNHSDSLESISLWWDEHWTTVGRYLLRRRLMAVMTWCKRWNVPNGYVRLACIRSDTKRWIFCADTLRSRH